MSLITDLAKQAEKISPNVHLRVRNQMSSQKLYVEFIGCHIQYHVILQFGHLSLHCPKTVDI